MLDLYAGGLSHAPAPTYLLWVEKVFPDPLHRLSTVSRGWGP